MGGVVVSDVHLLSRLRGHDLLVLAAWPSLHGLPRRADQAGLLAVLVDLVAVFAHRRPEGLAEAPVGVLDHEVRALHRDEAGDLLEELGVARLAALRRCCSRLDLVDLRVHLHHRHDRCRRSSRQKGVVCTMTWTCWPCCVSRSCSLAVALAVCEGQLDRAVLAHILAVLVHPVAELADLRSPKSVAEPPVAVDDAEAPGRGPRGSRASPRSTARSNDRGHRSSMLSSRAASMWCWPSMRRVPSRGRRSTRRQAISFGGVASS